MAQLNDNYIVFVGPPEQMHQILLTMAKGHFSAIPQLKGQGFDGLAEEPSESLENMDASKLAKLLHEEAVDPLVLLNPATKNVCTTDDYEFDPPCTIRGTSLQELDLDFSSGQGRNSDPLEDLGEFGTLLPSGTYAFGGLFRYEGDADFYLIWGEFQCGPRDADDFDEDRHSWCQDERVRPGRQREVMEVLKRDLASDGAKAYVAASLLNTLASEWWLDLPEYAGSKPTGVAASNAERNLARQDALDLLGEIPVDLGIRLAKSPYDGWNTLVPGTPVVVSSSWGSDGRAQLQARGTDGTDIGLAYRIGSLSRLPFEAEENETLDKLMGSVALLLPCLTARYLGMNPDTAFVRLDFAEPFDLKKTVAAIDSALAQDASERSLSTREVR